MGTSFAESEEPLFSSCFFLGFAEWIRNLTSRTADTKDKETQLVIYSWTSVICMDHLVGTIQATVKRSADVQ